MLLPASVRASPEPWISTREAQEDVQGRPFPGSVASCKALIPSSLFLICEMG